MLLEQRELEDKAKLEWLPWATQDAIDSIERSEGLAFSSMDDLGDYVRQMRVKVSAEMMLSLSVPDTGNRLPVAVSTEAARDLYETLKWSERQFGRNLFTLRRFDVASTTRCGANFKRLGAVNRHDLGSEVWVYHLLFNRERARLAHGIVKNPRHFIIFQRCVYDDLIDILRILHDGRDLARHVPID